MVINKLEIWYRDFLSTRGIMELIFKIALLPIYVLIILYNTLRRELYSAGVIGRKIVLKKAVISVGNINLGGAGKTPLIIYIARRLVIMGKKPSIVIGGEALADEALIYKAQLPDIKVFTEKNKKTAIERANDSSSDIIIIDDGFQLLNVKKTLDIVIIRDDVSPTPIPLGWGREHISALKYANCIFISKPSHNYALKSIHGISKPIFIMRQVPEVIVNAGTGKIVNISEIVGRKVLLFSMVPSIGYISYELSHRGIRPFLVQFPDHYRYKDEDIKLVLKTGRSADYIITTEKDMLSIKNSLKKSHKEIWTLKSKIDIKNESEFWKMLMKKLNV
ncbi:MAG: hypothetical protein DRH44_05325 [Candidatus Coatesbacteria bacterium]|nr:MAG: hypothetical protein DRH44_05325 [Candidatus Coatesbacteria bacterium]